MTTYSASFSKTVDSGLRLGDIESVIQAIINCNGSSSSYGINAFGNSQSNATVLTSVINEVDSVFGGNGVNLPNSSGRKNSAFQNCFISNNSGSTIQIYGAQGTSDTINGIAGSTGISLNSNTTFLFISPQKGRWFTVGSTSSGGGSGINRVVSNVAVNTTAGSSSLTDYVYFGTGTITITLPSAVGNTNRYSVSNYGTGTITVAAQNGQTIAGQSSVLISNQYNSMDFLSNNSSWGIF